METKGTLYSYMWRVWAYVIGYGPIHEWNQ